MESTAANGTAAPTGRPVRLPPATQERGLTPFLHGDPDFGEDRPVAMSTAAAEPAPEPPRQIGAAGILAAGAMGAVVAIALGLYGRAHDPQTDLAITLGFSDTITMKVWLSSIALLFAL